MQVEFTEDFVLCKGGCLVDGTNKCPGIKYIKGENTHIPANEIDATKVYTYTSTQATNCACCGERKHTPLRIDWMGGYVCLTCINNKLEELRSFIANGIII